MKHFFLLCSIFSISFSFAQQKHQEDSLAGFASKNYGSIDGVHQNESKNRNDFDKRVFIKQKYKLGEFGYTAKVDSLNTSACTNIGFELGNLNGWSVMSGTTIASNSSMLGCCPVAGGSATVTSAAFDTSCTTINSPLGGQKYVRINDEIANKGVTRINYSYPVTTSNTLLEYAYMFMSNRSNHACDSLPYMSVRILDASSAVIQSTFVTGPKTTGTCSTSPTYYGCIYYPNIVYMFDWKRKAVNLQSYIGTTVTIEVTVGDCTKGDHYGYGFFDARCSMLDPSCSNLDFEAGNLSTWIGMNGINNDSQKMSMGLVNSGNTESAVLTGGSDPNKGFSLVSPLGGKIVRLNDFNLTSINASVNRISRTYSITPSNTSLQYAYMSILQDGSHICSQQSYMDASIYDQEGNLIHSKKVYASGTACTLTASGFSLTMPFYFTNWQTQTLNLSAYTGSLVTVEFTAGDCLQFGHIGYSYFDTKCGIASSINEMNESNDVMIWPNPFSDALNITIPQSNTSAHELLIYDVTGKLITKKTLQNTNSYSLQNLSSGLYFYIILKDNQFVKSGKLVKE